MKHINNIGDSKQCISIGEVKQQLDHYFDYLKDRAEENDDMFLAAVLTRDAIMQVLDGGYDGIRIFLAKKTSSDSKSDITLIAAPVKKQEGTFTYITIFNENANTLVVDPDLANFNLACRYPNCPTTIGKTKLNVKES
ncbi:hypothetical protein [Fibrisoma limi]|uniref:hypothetical protein n=1 Tax=Fibrisoma limi TaxID=663275 RepID=UPI0005876EBB|nr:hypothetical protein [Fibrisoma limi]